MKATTLSDTRRTFGRTGLEVSPLGFGAAPIGFLGTNPTQIAEIVATLADSGINVIDTAAAYESSEEALGKALAGRRNEFVLISKCGQSFPDLPGREWSAELISQTIDRSLQRLGTDCLDVVLLHSCDVEVLRNGDAVAALVRARDAGKIRFLGYSGDNETAAEAAGMPDISVIETSVNLCDQANLNLVLPVAGRHGIGVIAKRPLANTAWRRADEMPGIYREYARPYCERFEEMKLASESHGDWPEIALRFSMFQTGVHVAIVGTTRPENIRRNVRAAAMGPLPEEVTARIREAFLAAESHSGGPWHGLT